MKTFLPTIDINKDLKKRKAEEEKNAELTKKAKTAEENAIKSVEEEKDRLIKKREEEKEKNERTLFVGNLPVSTIQKAEYKELKKTFSKYGNIESIRFRSVVSHISHSRVKCRQ